MDKQKVEEIRQQALLHSKPHAMQVQGRDKVTAEGMASREQNLSTSKENSISPDKYGLG